MIPLSPWLESELDALAQQGLLRDRTVTRWLPGGWCEVNGRRVLNFISNDYLGLASDPRVIAAAAQVITDSGVGSRASPLLGGRSEQQRDLESALAGFEGTAEALVFPTGFAANLGTLTALMGTEDTVYCDRLNHASLVDGCRLSGARLRVYRHQELDVLERELQKQEPAEAGLSSSRSSRPARRWIVTDGVFSMDGDLAPLPRLCELADRYAAQVIVDEAHATGVYGATGRGVSEHFGVEDRIAVRIGTLSKAFGCLGGFVAGSSLLVKYLWNQARTQIYSTALPPAVCASASAAISILQAEPERARTLQARSRFFRQELQSRNLTLLGEESCPIVPIVLSDPQRAVEIAHRLENRGFLVGAVRPPTVPQGTSRLRISLSLVHEEQRLADLASAVAAEVLP